MERIFDEFFESAIQDIIPVFDDITGIENGAEWEVETRISHVGKLALEHASIPIRNWVLFKLPFAGVGARTAQLHALWHDAKRELAPQDREMNPAKVWVQAVDMCLSTSISLADGKYQAGNKIANYRGDMARKAKLHVQSYYGMTELSSPERALKVQWLLQKDRFTCPTDMREVVYIVQRIEIFY